MLSCAHNEYMLTYMPFACCDMPLASVGVSAAEVERLLPLYEEGSTAPVCGAHGAVYPRVRCAAAV